MKKKITIITLSDNNYVQHLGVMFASLLSNKNDSTFLEIYIMSYGLSKENKNKLAEVLDNNQVSFSFLEINKENNKKFSTRNHISHAAYSKVNIPEIFPNLNKALFLDCDMIVMNDLFELWSEDISESAVAAVYNPKFDRHHQLKIPRGSKTFNSGVMLMNLTYMRDKKISEKVLSFLKYNSDKIDLHDQDGFNSVLYNDWFSIEPKWNLQTKFFEITSEETIFKKDEYEKALNEPSIIHYTTSSKPWHYFNFHPYRDSYYEYIKKTSWKDYKAIPNSKKEILFKNILMRFSYSFFLNIRQIARKINLKV